MAEHEPSIGATSEWFTPPEYFEGPGPRPLTAKTDVAPIEGSCSAIGLHLLIEPVTRPLASWNVVTPLLLVRAVPVVRPIAS